MMVSLLMFPKATLLFTLVKTEVGTLSPSHSWLTRSSNPSSDKLKKNLASITTWVSLFLVKKSFLGLWHPCSDETQGRSWWFCLKIDDQDEAATFASLFLPSLFTVAIIVLINYRSTFFCCFVSFFSWFCFEQSYLGVHVIYVTLTFVP